MADNKVANTDTAMADTDNDTLVKYIGQPYIGQTLVKLDIVL